jgi:hypothetical protein
LFVPRFCSDYHIIKAFRLFRHRSSFFCRFFTLFLLPLLLASFKMYL